MENERVQLISLSAPVDGEEFSLLFSFPEVIWRRVPNCLVLYNTKQLTSIWFSMVIFLTTTANIRNDLFPFP